jgi:hypothetical protein
MLLADMCLASSRAWEINFNKIKFWTDSIIVLAWLKYPAVRWKTLVANRVNHIQETIKIEDCNHISSKKSPTDLVSRCVDATVLRNFSLKSNDPNWLQQVETSWPHYEGKADNNEESKTVNPTPAVILLTQSNQEEIFTKFSSRNKLQRVKAYCLRFIHNCRDKKSRLQGPLPPSELNEAALVCVKRAQLDIFIKEKADLTEKGLHLKKSLLLFLNPFLDGNQFLRVGGRLRNAGMMLDQQYPLILQKGHHITTLIIEDIHKKNLHVSGQLLLLSLTRQKFWIPDARNALRKITKKILAFFKT